MRLQTSKIGRSQRRWTRSGVPTHTRPEPSGVAVRSQVPYGAAWSARRCTQVRLGAHSAATP
jgi:hypothetical protein